MFTEHMCKDRLSLISRDSNFLYLDKTMMFFSNEYYLEFKICYSCESFSKFIEKNILSLHCTVEVTRAKSP